MTRLTSRLSDAANLLVSSAFVMHSFGVAYSYPLLYMLYNTLMKVQSISIPSVPPESSMSGISILRIGPFPIDSNYAFQLREAILQYLAETTTTTTAVPVAVAVPVPVAAPVDNPATLERTSNGTNPDFQFSITNRYFSANVRLAGIDDDNELSNDTTTETTASTTMASEDGIILVFDAERSYPKYATSITSSFDAMEAIHDQAVRSHQCGELLRLVVSIGNQRVVQYNGTTHPLSDQEYEEEYSRRILWCLDRGYEYIEVPDLSDTSQGHDVRDKDGFARIIEAISGTVWTSAIMASPQQQTLQKSFAETRKDINNVSTPVSAPPDPDVDGGYEPPNPSDFSFIAVDENDQERERKAHKALLADCVTEATTDVTNSDATTTKNEQQQQQQQQSEELQQERAMNALEASLNEARRIRELSKSGQLSDEERRKRATDAAMLILQTMEQMGFQDDEDDDDEDLDDDNSLVVDDTLEEK